MFDEEHTRHTMLHTESEKQVFHEYKANLKMWFAWMEYNLGIIFNKHYK